MTTVVGLVGKLAEAQARTDASLTQLAEAQSRTDERLNVFINVVERRLSGKGNKCAA